MTTTAFRNLLNCQYERTIKVKGEKLTQMVNKAFMTYEEVLKAMSLTLCEEEADLFVMMLCSTKFPTREEQKAREEIEEAKKKIAEEKANMFFNKKLESDKIALKKRIEESRVLTNTGGKPVFWNDPKIGGTGTYKGKKGGERVRESKPE
jgi:hypothetical protein